MQKLTKFYKFLLYILPLVLFFSYFPLIHFGVSESMNFEISLPLIWLAIFDIATLILMWQRKLLFRKFGKKWLWLLLPIWLTISILWSLNSLRGLLTVGILWLIYFAGYSIWSLRSLLDNNFRQKFWKWFFGSTLAICAWCLIQSILDILGVSQDYTLMCDGCTYKMFGFPHPNGFAVEPQFMGNLLLAPLLISGYFALTNSKKYLWLLAIFAFTLFLTFSRGAIYAFGIGIVALTIFIAIKHRAKWQTIWKKLGLVWLTVILSFVATLCTQGILAQVSPTNDTFQTGVAKVLNHLSLGVIDIRAKSSTTQAPQPENQPVENLVENSTSTSEDSAFDGYVPESTDIRVGLTNSALTVWSQNPITMLFGVGIGGAGQALYIHDATSAPKEIVQNEYASLLLETGLVGISLFIFTLMLASKSIAKNRLAAPAIMALIIAYAVTLFFFSGLPNALQIYLLPVILLIVLNKK